MYGEGYDFPPLYTPSSGNIAGALPVGIQTRAERDIPYWPVQSTWTYKEVWVHPVSQWIGLMSDIVGPAVVQGKTDRIYNPDLRSENAFDFEVSKVSTAKAEVIITARIQGTGSHKFSIRTSNLTVISPSKQVNLKSGGKITLKWYGRTESPDEPWVAVIVADNDLSNHKELIGAAWEK
jgi:hypothetical protein